MAYRTDTFKIDGKCTRTKEGFLRTDAIITRSGVFRYRSADGSERLELRADSEVFKEVSVNSIRMIPLTNNHPDVGVVTSDNIRDLQVGYTGDSVKVEKPYIKVPVTITDRDTMKEIDNGKCEISGGYFCDVAENAGTHPEYGVYTHVQSNMVYNHAAIVDRGRAGPNVKLKMDQLRVDGETDIAFMVDSIEPENKIDNKTKTPLKGGRPMAIKLINSIGYEAAQEVVNHCDTLEKQLVETTRALSTSQADAAVQKSRADKAEADLASMPAKMAASLATRRKLEADASAVLPKETKMDAMTDAQIHTAVVAARFPEIKLDGRDEVFVSHMFEAALAIKGTPASVVNDSLLGGGGFVPPADSTRMDSADFDPMSC